MAAKSDEALLHAQVDVVHKIHTMRECQEGLSHLIGRLALVIGAGAPAEGNNDDEAAEEVVAVHADKKWQWS